MSGYALVAVRYAVVAIFGVAFVSKVRPSAFRRFAEVVARLTSLPPRVVTVLAVAVVAAEGTTAALVAGLPSVRPGCALAVGLLALFIGAIARAVRAGILAECRCFGRGAIMSIAMIGRNALMIAVALPGVVVPAGPVPEPGYVALAAGAGLLVAVFLIRYYDRMAAAVGRRLAPPATS